MKTVCGTSTGSYSTKKYFTTLSPTGISESVPHHGTDVEVYPNPATTKFHIAITSDSPQQAQLIISDITGKIIYSEKRLLEHGENIIDTDVSHFTKGIYLLSLRTETENTINRIAVE